jgi:poly(A) polymerase|tara:strand:+ start:126 stop:869 length:744 start_codon:yes stop_codon:yes gene_type:complete
MKHKIFEIGGCVRDELLGLHTKDIDFTVVIDQRGEKLSVDEGWAFMKHFLLSEGFKIFLETKDCFTIRAMFPKGHQHKGLVADFVMARKEVGYTPGTRRPILELGTLEDDIRRRDFTVNSLAKDENGDIIDLFNGKKDLEDKILKTPLDPRTTLMDDPLRLLRALRFSITKGFKIEESLWDAMFQPELLGKLMKTVSQERIREEVTKMMKHDTVSTIRLLQDIDKKEPILLEIIFGGNMWLLPSTKK